jgi:membrane protein YdbS with pleckstrin-like domain
MSYLSIFKTSQYSFEGKKPYENVLVLINRHWFVLLGKALVYGLLLILPFVIYGFFGETIVDIGLNNAFWLGVAIFYLIWWNTFFYSLTMYLLDIWIVTDHRVIDSRQHGFFSRTISELSLSRIQDLSVHVAGPLSTFIDFGNLEIQTAGSEPKFIFEEISHPGRIKDEIMEAHNRFINVHKDGVEVHEGGKIFG